MVVIRLVRGGSHNKPFFFVVVADSRARVQGKFIEKVGYYNPLKKTDTEFQLNLEKIQYWISVGAKPSPAVAKLLRKYTKENSSTIAA